MTFSTLYLLPAVAILILFDGSLVTIDVNRQIYRPRRNKIRARTQAYFYRCLVVVLLLATIITKKWPTPNLYPLLQGLLVTAAIMAPLAGILALISYFQTSQLKKPLATNNDDTDHTLIPDTNPDQSTPVSHRTPSLQSPSTQQQNKPATTSNSREKSTPDQTSNISEQLEIPDEPTLSSDIVDDGTNSTLIKRTAVAIARKDTLNNSPAQNHKRQQPAAKSGAESTDTMDSVDTEKKKLENLTRAQKEVIEAKKRALQHTRLVAKDAILVAQSAKHGQQMAEKIAHREKVERQRLEKDLNKAQQQLNNALSTIENKRKSPTEET